MAASRFSTFLCPTGPVVRGHFHRSSSRRRSRRSSSGTKT